MSDAAHGWMGWANISAEERARRVAEAERAHQAEEQRRQLEHRAVFGEGAMTLSVSRITMPLSGRSFWWRSDGYLATMSAAELAEWDAGRLGADDPEPDQWGPWQGPSIGTSVEFEAIPGDRPDPTWWLVWGEVYPGDVVECWLADNTDVAVTRLGCLWIAEYRSIAQPLFVSINGEVDDVPAHRGSFLPPPAHPFRRSARNPRA